jgi:hypothetical protein
MSEDPAAAPPSAQAPGWQAERALVERLNDPLLNHDDALIAIATAFGASDRPHLMRDWLDEAARPLFSLPDPELRRRGRALADLMTNGLGLRTDPEGHESLLLDRLIVTRRGHPLLLATVAHELARRAGWTSVTAHAGEHALTALVCDGVLLPIAYAAEDIDCTQLRVICPHTVADATLAAIGRTAPSLLAASTRRVRHALAIFSDTQV